MPIEVTVFIAFGQAVAFLGAAIAAASIFATKSMTFEFIKKAASRGLAAVAAGMFIQAIATTSMIIVPVVGN